MVSVHNDFVFEQNRRTAKAVHAREGTGTDEPSLAALEIVGGYDDFLTGFMTDPQKSEVWGRPVGLVELPDGSLLVSDDGGEKIWRVSYQN